MFLLSFAFNSVFIKTFEVVHQLMVGKKNRKVRSPAWSWDVLHQCKTPDNLTRFSKKEGDKQYLYYKYNIK